MRTIRKIIVPEINLVNFFFFYPISFFFQIETFAFTVTNILRRYTRNRIKYINIKDYLDWQQTQILDDKAVSVWTEILNNFQYFDKDHLLEKPIDMRSLVLHKLKNKLGIFVFIDYISQRHHIKVVDDFLTFSIKKKCFKLNKFPISFISKINILMEYLSIIFENIVLFFYTFFLFLDGIINNKSLRSNIKHIYDVSYPGDLSSQEKDITFSWLIDNKLLKKDETFFLLPNSESDFGPTTNRYEPSKNNNEFLASYHRQISRFSSRRHIVIAFLELCKLFLQTFFYCSIQNLIKFKFKIKMIQYLPFIKTVNPKNYISNLDALIEKPSVLVFLNAMDIKTIIFSHSTHSYLFIEDLNSNCEFRNLLFCNIMAHSYIVWNNHFKEFILKHPQDAVEIKVLGPLLSGKEDIFNSSKKRILKKYNLTWDYQLKYVVVFDCPTVVSSKIRANGVRYPYPHDENYNFLFMKDMYTLLLDFQNIILLYKPKRNSSLFAHSPSFLNLFQTMKHHPRVIMLDYNINPWVPIFSADMCISIPFCSPTIAGLHYYKPSLFHDPTNIAKFHLYEDCSEIISHNYEELKKKVHLYLYNENAVNDLFQKPHIKNLQGQIPKTNTTNQFLSYLIN